MKPGDAPLRRETALLAVITTFYLLTLISLPSFELSKAGDAFATAGVSLASLVAFCFVFRDRLRSRMALWIAVFGIVMGGFAMAVLWQLM